MVRPKHFRYNEQTAASNAFQEQESRAMAGNVSDKARSEFETLAEKLKDAGVLVYLFDEEKDTDTPDAVFPNNWISFHPDGRIVLYPMLAPNRRLERRLDVIERIGQDFSVGDIIDLSFYELEGLFLEGTGSIVFDHVHKKAYANQSPRTSPRLFRQCCDLLGYQPILFRARDRQGMDIYHTNVMMALGQNVAVICLEAMPNKDVRNVVHHLEQTGHDILSISLEQMEYFAGNMMQLIGTDGNLMLMSDSAYQTLTAPQLQQLEKNNRILFSNLSTIEHYGGGSARCMIAGIHLPKLT